MYRRRYRYRRSGSNARRIRGRYMTPRQYSAMMRKLSQITTLEKLRFDIESMRLRDQSRANFERSLRRRW
jgi:hypothetical protein